MSLYFDFVINCDLRPDTPQEYIDAIRYLTSPKGTAPLPPKSHMVIRWGQGEEGLYDLWQRFFTGEHVAPFLAPDPEWDVISRFQKMHRTNNPATNEPIYHYCLQFVARSIHDDIAYPLHMNFFYWLPIIAVDGLIGYYKEKYSNKVNLLYAKNGLGFDQDDKPVYI